MKRLRKYFPFLVSTILLIVLVSYAPFHEIRDALRHFNDWDVPLLIILSAAYYGLKALRWQYLLQSIGIFKPLKIVLLSYMVSQPVSLIPGGEIYRSHSLKRFTGVPIRRSIAQFTLQGYFEALSLTSIAVISALVLGVYAIPFVLLAIGLIFSVRAIQLGHVSTVSHLVNRLPFIKITGQSIENFSKDHQSALSGRWFAQIYGFSVFTDLFGVAIAYVAVTGVGGELSIFQAVLLYVIPIVVGFLSFLPGGVGASEQSAVGILLLSDVSLSQAVAATLVMRTAIVGLGVFYGVLSMGVAQMYDKKTTKLLKSEV